MVRDDALQDLLLPGLEIDEEHVLALLEDLLEALEVRVRVLDPPQSAFPGEEAERDDREEDPRDPPGRRVGQPGVVGADQHGHRGEDAEPEAEEPGVDDVLAHQGGDLVEVAVVLGVRVVERQDVDLRRDHARLLELLLEVLEVVEVVADEEIARRLHARLPSTATARNSERFAATSRGVTAAAAVRRGPRAAPGAPPSPVRSIAGFSPAGTTVTNPVPCLNRIRRSVVQHNRQ